MLYWLDCADWDIGNCRKSWTSVCRRIECVLHHRWQIQEESTLGTSKISPLRAHFPAAHSGAARPRRTGRLRFSPAAPPSPEIWKTGNLAPGSARRDSRISGFHSASVPHRDRL